MLRWAGPVTRAHTSVSPGVWPGHPSGSKVGAARGPRLLPWGGPLGRRRSAQGVADLMERGRGPARESPLGLSAGAASCGRHPGVLLSTPLDSLVVTREGGPGGPAAEGAVLRGKDAGRGGCGRPRPRPAGSCPCPSVRLQRLLGAPWGSCKALGPGHPRVQRGCLSRERVPDPAL